LGNLLKSMGIQAATKNEITVYLFRVFLIAAMKLFVRISVCTFAFIFQAFAECYYPDGKVASGLTPCNSTAKVSHCCRDADVCLSNGLCFSTGLGTIIRRGCTDSSFNDTVCPAFCIKDAGGMFRYLPHYSTVSWGKADRLVGQGNSTPVTPSSHLAVGMEVSAVGRTALLDRAAMLGMTPLQLAVET
jgi:hypothetical protein